MAELTPEMIAGYTAGTLSSYQIAARLGCSQPTALKRLRAAGVDTSRNRTQEPTVVIPPEVVRAYTRREASMADVARSLGCSRGGVRKALIRAGVELHPRRAIDPAPGRPKAENCRRYLRDLLRWLKPRYPVRTIAAVLGVSPGLVTVLRR